MDVWDRKAIDQMLDIASGLAPISAPEKGKSAYRSWKDAKAA